VSIPEALIWWWGRASTAHESWRGSARPAASRPADIPKITHPGSWGGEGKGRQGRSDTILDVSKARAGNHPSDGLSSTGGGGALRALHRGKFRGGVRGPYPPRWGPRPTGMPKLTIDGKGSRGFAPGTKPHEAARRPASECAPTTAIHPGTSASRRPVAGSGQLVDIDKERARQIGLTTTRPPNGGRAQRRPKGRVLGPASRSWRFHLRQFTPLGLPGMRPRGGARCWLQIY